MTSNGQERSWDVHGLRLAGLEWGPPEGVPVLALHGWMDHAASFRDLAPRLTGCRVVALDLSGQGLSDHRAPHATYNIWDDLPQIAKVLDRLGWAECVLLGHSRGANIASLFAAAQPDRVRALVTLDSLVPDPGEATVVDTMRAFIEDTERQMARPPRVFATRDDYVKRRSAQGNTAATADALADRALAGSAEGFRMRGDARMFASSAVKLTQVQVEDVLRAIQCPALTLWAADGLVKRHRKITELQGIAARRIVRYEALTLPGDHHFHLDPACVDEIARATLDFLGRHDVI